MQVDGPLDRCCRSFKKDEAPALGVVDRRYRDVVVDRKMKEVLQKSDVTPGRVRPYSSLSGSDWLLRGETAQHPIL
ncbi:hypothetical protein ACC739_37740, partial [Rhizobium ruizarguesonis]